MRLLFIFTFFLICCESSEVQKILNPETDELESPRYVNAVTKIVDGDTVILGSYFTKGGQEIARLIGIDTPEIAHEKYPEKLAEKWGPEATVFTKKWIDKHDEEYEVINSKDDDDGYDKYDRLLIWIFEGDEVLNIELVKAGLAKVKFYGSKNLKYEKELLEAEKIAKKYKRKIWSGE